MTNPKHVQWRVGLFVGAGLILFAFTVLILGGSNYLFTDYYKLHAEFKQVQGLTRGSVVSLAGVKIGNIKDIDFQSTNEKLIVTLDIDKSVQSRITEGSVAEIRTQGALGDKFIYIIPGPSSAPVLPPNGFLVTSGGNDIIEALSGKGGDLSRIFDIIQETQKFMHALNTNQRSDRIMENLANMSEKMNLTVDQINSITKEIKAIEAKEDLNKSIKRLSNILEKIDEGQGTLGLLINDPIVYERLKNFLGDSPRNKHIKNLIRGAIQKEENP